VWVADALGQHSETPPHGSQFSPLDLYLMGVALPEEVEPFQLLRNATVPGLDCQGQPVSAASPPQTCASVEASGQPARVAIDDILAVEGPRQPAASRSARSLSALVIVLDGTPAPFDAAMCREFAGVLAQRFSDFRAATADRLQLEPARAGQGDCDETAWTPPVQPPASGSESGGCSVGGIAARPGSMAFSHRSVRRPAGPGEGSALLLVLLGLAIRASKARRARLESPP
jgi:hypothetical protein